MVNIVICGTPGTGKSSLMDKLKSEELDINLNFINLSKFALDNDCIVEYDEEFESHVIDEEKLAEKIEPLLTQQSCESSNIIESIHADILPLEHIDWIFVCRTDNNILYDRLSARGYNEKKISNNIQAEIFQTILDEAREHFDDVKRITELSNDKEDDLVSNVHLVANKVRDLLVSVRRAN